MKGLKLLVSLILALSFFTTGLYAQELPAEVTEIKASADVERDRPADDDTIEETPAGSSLTAISSTAPGGLWSSPSTWAGGVVPGVNDEVTISPGSAVIIDTVVNIANLTVGPISIGGTVTASNGVGIRNAVVTVSGGNLQAPISFVTGTFGTYQFQNLDPGGEYTVFVSAKRNRFTPPSQLISSFSSVSNVNFTANPPE